MNKGLLPATGLPAQLPYDDAARVVVSNHLGDCDLKVGDTGPGLWVVDKNAEFRRAPMAMDNYYNLGHCQKKWGLWPFKCCCFIIGRGLESSDLVLPHEYISRRHLILKMFPDRVRVKNISEKNGVFIGGAWLGPGENFDVRPDAPFLIGFKEPASKLDGSLLVSPLNTSWDNALISARGSDVRIDREPWEKMIAGAKAMAISPKSEVILRQATDVMDEIVTPEQIYDVDRIIYPTNNELNDEGLHIRTSIRNWLEAGRLDGHVKGDHKWDKRLLANVRNGGIMLPTHSTDLEGAIAILKSGRIDPEHFRKKKAFFRYGLGHSYGPIVFVQRPGVGNIGKINDIWHVMNRTKKDREELFRLVGDVDYNRNIKVKPVQRDEVKPYYGQSIIAQKGIGADDSPLMELFPQFESTEPVSIDNSYVIMVPEHLYQEMIDNVPVHLHDMLIKIPGTGKTEKDFLEGRERVARRTRVHGGDFQPVIGYEALFRYELVYFKIVETLLRSRHRMLRRKLEELASDAARSELTHADIVARISDISAFLPESFHVLHYQKQYPSHDGHSPLGHTLNALLEAAYLAPALAREFNSLHVEDDLIALTLHDIGKIHGAKEDDHDDLSVEMARYHLKMMGLNAKGDDEARERRERILDLIRKMGLISEASLAMEGGEEWETVAGRLSPKVGPFLTDIFLLNFADVASIPGRSGRKMRVNTNYNGVIDVRPRIIEVFRRFLKATK